MNNKKTAATDKAVRCCGRIHATYPYTFFPKSRGRSGKIASRSSDLCLSEIPAVTLSLPGFPVTDFHPKSGPLAFTAAVPSGNFTRFSILSRGRTLPETLAEYGLISIIVQIPSGFVNRQNRCRAADTLGGITLDKVGDVEYCIGN